MKARKESKLNFRNHPTNFNNDIPYYKDFEHINPRNLTIKKNNLILENVKETQKTGEKNLFKFLGKEMVHGLKKFLYKGSLHGIKYILEPKYTIKERMIWFVIMFISVSVCAYNIYIFLSKSHSTPFVNVMDSIWTPIWAVPFPLVVICPQLHVKLSYLNVSSINGVEEFYASLVCPQISKRRRFTKERLTAEEVLNLQKFIVDAAPQCTDIIKACRWKSINEDWMTSECCESLFRPLLTSYGLCFAFNQLPLNGMSNETLAWQRTYDPDVNSEALNWSLDTGYPKLFPPDLFLAPLRTTAAGEINGLGVDLHTNTNEHQYDCDGNSFGFNVLITSPAEHTYTSTVLRLPMERLTTIEITPVTFKTDTLLRNLKPQRRECLFQDETKLEYFNFYTDSNCKQNILINDTKEGCGCVPYNWPRKSVDESICSTEADFQCIATVDEKVTQRLMYADFSEDEHHHVGIKVVEDLKPHRCYPPCTDIYYHYNVFYSALAGDPGKSSRKTDIERGESTRIDVHFYDDLFLGLHRHTQYDDLYFIGAIGGLLSLFLGFSLISIAELAWFTILRPLRRALRILYYK